MFKSYASLDKEALITDELLSTASSLGGVTSCLARGLFGKLVDVYDFKRLYFLILGLNFLNIHLSYFFVTFTPIYFFCILLNSFCMGACFVCLPASVANVFGAKYGSSVYSFVILGSLASSTLNTLNAKYVLAPYGFDAGFSICYAVTLIGLVVLMNFEEKLDVDRVFKKQQQVVEKVINN